MDVELVELENKRGELFFNIVDKITKLEIGILFTVNNNVAYEIKPEFRGKGAATNALKLITSQIKRPVLEIKHNNIASKRVAIKSGYVLVREQSSFEIYEYLKDESKSK